MLKIWYGQYKGEDYMRFPKDYFDNQYEESWLDEERSKLMIKDIDKSEYIGNSLVKSPVFGVIPITQLSGGVRTLILLDNLEEEFTVDVTGCGDNCAKWLLEIGRKKDLNLSLRYYMKFDFQDNDRIMLLNTGEIYDNYIDLMSNAGKYIYKRYEE